MATGSQSIFDRKRRVGAGGVREGDQRGGNEEGG